MTDQVKGLLYTVMGVLFVVPDSLFIRLIDAPGLVISFWRGAICGAVVLSFILLKQGSAPIRTAMNTGFLGALYAVTLGLSGVLFTLAVQLTSVANVVFIVASMPVFAALYSFAFMGEPIRKRMVLTMLAVFAGIGVIVYGSGETEGASLLGDLVALSVAAVFAISLTIARKLRPVSMVPMLPVAYLMTSLAILPFIAPFSIPDGQWHLPVLHGLFFAVSSVGLAVGPRFIPSAEVALLILLESVLAPLLVWAVLGENPGLWALAGGAIVLCALAVSNVVALRRQGAAA